MRLQLKVRNGRVSDAVRGYAEQKVGKLEKRLHDPDTLVEIVLSREHNPAISDDHMAEVIVFAKGSNLTARDFAPTYEAAVDRVVDKLERQLERYKGKRNRHEAGRRAASHGTLPEPTIALDDAPEPESAA